MKPQTVEAHKNITDLTSEQLIAKLAISEVMLRSFCRNQPQGANKQNTGSSGSRAERADTNTLPTLEPDLGNASVGKRPERHIRT